MINTTLLTFRNLLIIGIIAVFARSLLAGFLQIVNDGGNGAKPAADDDDD